MINLGWALFLKKKKNDLTKLTTNELRKIGKYFHHLLSFLKKQNCLRKLKKHYKIRKICCFELVCIYKYTYYLSMHSIIFFYEDYKIWWYLCNQTDNFSNEPTLNSRLSKKNVSLLYNRHFVQISDVCVRYGGVRCNTQQQQKYFFSFFSLSTIFLAIRNAFLNSVRSYITSATLKTFIQYISTHLPM